MLERIISIVQSSSTIPTNIGDAYDDQIDTFDNANIAYFDAWRLLQVDFASFATILREIGALTESKTGEVFYDLGSGTGKALYVVRSVAVCIAFSCFVLMVFV